MYDYTSVRACHNFVHVICTCSVIEIMTYFKEKKSCVAIPLIHDRSPPSSYSYIEESGSRKPWSVESDCFLVSHNTATV